MGGRETQYQVAPPERAAAGGRRSKGGIPWSGRRDNVEDGGREINLEGREINL